MPSLKEIVTAKHPDYTSRVSEWEFYSDAYAGGPAWAQKANPLAVSGNGFTGAGKYLVRFPLETSDNYFSRVNKSVYINLAAPAVDMLASTVGSPANIQRELPSGYDEIWDDVDLQGNDYLSFMLSARTAAATFGHVLILVDSRKAAGEIRTQADAIAQRIRPFLRLINPVDVLNWKMDGDGNLTELLFRVAVEPEGSILDGGKRDPIFEYRYWSPSEWKVFQERNDDVVLLEQGPNPLGEVPVSVLYHKRIGPLKGESLLKDSARWAMLVSNWLSQVDSVVERQSFSQACLRSESAPSQVGVGQSVVLHLAPERKTSDGDIIGESDFFYRSPETGPLQILWDGIDRGIRMANKSMGLQPDVTTDTASPESGISRAWRWHDTERRLIAMATSEQACANDIFRLLAAWQGQNEFSGSVTYSTKFDLSSVQDAITNAIELQAVGIPRSARRELARVALAKALPSLPADVQTQIDEELERLGAAEKKLDQLVSDE